MALVDIPSFCRDCSKCGVCHGTITVVGRKTKNGVRYASLGCNGHWMRGATICANNKTVSDKKAVAGVVGELKKVLSQPREVAAFLEGFKQRILEHSKADDGSADFKRRIATTQRNIANLTNAIGKMGFSEAIANRLKEEESKLHSLKGQEASAAAKAGPEVIPHPKAIEGFLVNLLRLLETDPVRARQELVAFMPPFVLTPTPEGYRATGAFDMNVLLNAKPPRFWPRGSLVKMVAGAGFEPTTFGL